MKLNYLLRKEVVELEKLVAIQEKRILFLEKEKQLHERIMQQISTEIQKLKSINQQNKKS